MFAAVPVIVALIAHPTWQVIVAVEIIVALILISNVIVFARVARPVVSKVEALRPEARDYQKACNIMLASLAVMLSLNVVYSGGFALLYALEHL